MMKNLRWLLFLLCTYLCSSCKKTFEYSPYSGDVPAYYNALNTEKNLQKIQAQTNGNGTFRVAFISDTHYFHDEFTDAINQVNNDNSIDFVVICGDMSDQGLNKEYLYFYDQAKEFNKPMLTVIGNHDYLANAERAYAEMFGPVNYTLDHEGYRFIFFDDIFWEKGAKPDFDWMEAQARSANTAGLKPVLISHIPYFGDQYDSISKNRELQIIKQENITLSVHGHQHTYSYTSIFDSTDHYKCLVVPTIGKRSYCIVTFSHESAPVVTTVNLY